MKNINMSIVYLFYKVFFVLKIKLALINCSWSKAPSKTALNNGLIVLITAQLGVARPDWGQREVRKITPGRYLSWGSLADDMFSLCSFGWTTRTEDNANPGQLIPKTIRTICLEYELSWVRVVHNQFQVMTWFRQAIRFAQPFSGWDFFYVTV